MTSSYRRSDITILYITNYIVALPCVSYLPLQWSLGKGLVHNKRRRGKRQKMQMEWYDICCFRGLWRQDSNTGLSVKYTAIMQRKIDLYNGAHHHWSTHYASTNVILDRALELHLSHRIITNTKKEKDFINTTNKLFRFSTRRLSLF